MRRETEIRRRGEQGQSSYQTTAVTKTPKQASLAEGRANAGPDFSGFADGRILLRAYMLGQRPPLPEKIFFPPNRPRLGLFTFVCALLFGGALVFLIRDYGFDLRAWLGEGLGNLLATLLFAGLTTFMGLSLFSDVLYLKLTPEELRFKSLYGFKKISWEEARVIDSFAVKSNRFLRLSKEGGGWLRLRTLGSLGRKGELTITLGYFAPNSAKAAAAFASLLADYRARAVGER